MPRWIRMLLIGAAVAAVGLAVVLGAAWALLPRDWISKEAQRQAAQLSGAEVRWKSLEPGIEGFSIGVRLRGFAFRAPAKGDPTIDARAQEVFVRFKLLPLLSRRVEVAAARIRGAGIATWERAPLPEQPKAAAPANGASGMALFLPRLELDGVDIRTRDRNGGGIDVRRLRGSTNITGTLQSPQGVRIDVTADSLFWKGSARDPRLALPTPFRLDLAMKAGGGKNRLEVESGQVSLGDLRSDMSGAVTIPPPPAPAMLALVIRGGPAEWKSSDPLFQALTAASPATWSTKASWEIQIGGTTTAMVQNGILTLRPVQITADANKVSLDEFRVDWATATDRTFKANAKGGGSGLSVRLEANGSMEPGGETSGTLEIDAPAARLNGLLPDTPEWKAGTLAVRAIFSVRAPAPPAVRWTVTGRDLSGTAPGVAQPIRRLAFQVAGDDKKIEVRSMSATVGSSTALVKGEVIPGEPLGTGAFTVNVDRFVAEEWAPPPAARKGGASSPPSAAAPPPLPFRRLTADVTIGELHQGGMIVRDVSVPVRYEDEALHVEPIRGSVGEGTISGSLTVNDLIAAPSYALHLGIAKAPVAEVARGLLPFELGLSGLLNGEVDLSGPGLPGPEVGESLRGSIAGTVEQGRLIDNEPIRKIRNTLGLNADADMAFKTISHVLRIERGKLLLDKVRGDLGADKFELTGALGLDKGLDLRLLLRLAPERLKGGGTLGELARYARDADGRIPVELGIGGTTDKPRVQLKAGKILDVAGQGLKESLTKSLTSTLESKARKAGGDSLGSAADSTGAPGDSAVEDPLRKGREAIQRLLGK